MTTTKQAKQAKAVKLTGIILSCILVITMTGLSGCSGKADKKKFFVEPTVIDNQNLPSIELNGIKFHSEVFGKEHNKTIIVLHGGPGNDYRYLLDLKALSDQYKVVFYDQRGSGLSERVPEEQLSLDDFIADLDAFIEYYGKGEAILIGHSWGAMLAVDYTKRFSDKVQQLVLAEPGYLTPEMFQEFMNKTNQMKPGEITKEVAGHLIKSYKDSFHTNNPDKYAREDYFLEKFITGLNIPDHPLAGYYKDRDIQNGVSPTWRFGALVSKYLPTTVIDKKGNMTYSFAEGIEKYQPEVLLIASEYNTIIGADCQKKHLKLFNNARLEIIEDAGHTMIGEQPEKTIKVIREYLK